MNIFSSRFASLILAAALFAATPALAQSGGVFDLSWNTVDGGGHMWHTGGVFTLGGTTGQPDAGYHTGGPYFLSGGFWAIVLGSPDLTIVKSDGGASVAPGGTVAYTLTYSNAGDGVATGVTLTETVPANTVFNAGASTAGWSCVPTIAAGSTCTLALGTLDPAEAGSATFAVTADNPIPAGVTQISNTVTIGDDGLNGVDATPADNTSSDTTPVTGAPDFSLTKTDGGASVAPGGTVVYTLAYANTGNRGATGVVITETVPANTVFNPGASTPGWSCTPDNNAGSTCTFALGSLPAGVGSSVAFGVTVANPVPAGATQIANTATIADDGANGADPTAGNNTGSDTTPITGAPDLSVTKSDGAVTVLPGGTVTYTLTYANTGTRGASGVVLTETVPANTTFNAGSSSAGWICAPNNNAGSTCTLAVGTVAGGTGGSRTFAVTVANPLPAGVTEVSNTATISDDGSNGTDTNPGNNSGSDTTPTTGAPDLVLTKSDGGASTSRGGTISYTLTYSNAGNRDATGVVITDTVPANTTFNSGASTAGWSCVPGPAAGSTCTFAAGAVAAGAPAQSIVFAVTVDDPLAGGVTQISNQASIADDSANGTDPNMGNNAGSDTTPVDPPAVPPAGTKSVTFAGGTLQYRLVWINSGNTTPINVRVLDGIPAGTTYAAGSVSCSPQGTSTTSTCTYDAVNNQIVWEGTLGADSGAASEAAAANELVITFTVNVGSGTTHVENTASAVTDTNRNGSFTDEDPGTTVTTNTATWDAAAVAIPAVSLESLLMLMLLMSIVGVVVLRNRG